MIVEKQVFCDGTGWPGQGKEQAGLLNIQKYLAHKYFQNSVRSWGWWALWLVFESDRPIVAKDLCSLRYQGCAFPGNASAACGTRECGLRRHMHIAQS